MDKLRLQRHDDLFEMTVSPERDAALQNFGDAHVIIKVQSHGFVGHNNTWIDGRAMVAFSRRLCLLDKTLKGEASVSGISPGELSLKVPSVSSFGHLAVEGTIGSHFQGEHGAYFHSITFGFEFDQEQLRAAVVLPWIQRYTAASLR